MYGFYSEEIASVLGYGIYENDENEEIKVTFVCDKISDIKSGKWTDLKYVGKVTKYIRNVDDPFSGIFHLDKPNFSNILI
jgi:hypothetical protein